ncbi:uncharacterized protein N7483_004519 [Penicillium malachiteum]|uniref:uncharacterized protein n=1 Tax=Penicillium malachiteum TaxID=1324776 RepID=UPI002546F583|nr:uncharacterized protein N7483_004519 [Penicillium malachiteum]KAJ5730011.1 hypothetical protein N7483_004519 [Penicillium malachiteum]
MAQPEDPKLFEQCRTAQQLAAVIEEYGGEPLIHHSTPTKEETTGSTHIVSGTINFETYDLACKALIPVVKPSWVHTSLQKRKIANPRQHSPDPRLFLNDVVVTCGDIPEGDKDAIIGGVLAKGGLYSSRMSAMVTHLVDLTIESDKARLARAKNPRAKIILPHWFDDCLKLGQRIDERPYILPDPEILRAGPDDPIRGNVNKSLAGASTPEPAALPTPNDDERMTPSVFDGKTIMLSPDLGVGSRLLDSIETVIKQGGADVTGNVNEADWVICRFREGVVYRTASRLNKEVGNLAWLYSLMTFNEYTRPLSRLLHYPVSRSPVPGFEGLKISLSNYVGEARIYLENLIAAAGADCTKTLKQENTHLVTAHGTSEKCTAAREWGLQVVNHLWLEDSYAAWKLQPVSDPRYNHFPSRTNLGDIAGQKMLDRDVLEKNFFSSEDTKPSSPQPAKAEKSKNATTMQPPTEKSRKADKKAAATTDGTIESPQANGKGRKVAEKKIQTPIRSRLVPDDKENETPSSTSSRKSKEAAIAHLHELAPDIALYEKERKRVGGVIHGGRRKSDEDRVRENPKKRRSVDAEGESDTEQANEAKRPKKSRPTISMHLLITGYQPWVGKGKEKKEDADKRHLRDLGIMVIQDARRCTHMAAPSILRTTKFVNALAYAPFIVSTDFITECLKQDELLNPADFPLVDKAAENKFGFSMVKAIGNAKDNKNKLLKGFRIYCIDDIRGGFDAFKSIVEANGGECLVFRGRLALTNPSRREESDDEDSDMEDNEPGRHDVFLLSSAESKHARLWPRFRQVAGDIKRTPRIVRVDWLLDMAMSQELKGVDEYELTEEMIEDLE